MRFWRCSVACSAALILPLCVFSVPATAQSERLQWQGYLNLAAQAAEAAQPALRGGDGRLQTGRSGAGIGTGTALDAEARLGLRWSLNEAWSLFAHGLARTGASAAAGRALGLVEAGIDFTRTDPELDHRWRLRAGQFFYPGSREHIEALWSTPFSSEFSVLNSWIAEEFRPIGVDLGRRWTLNSATDHTVELAATVFCCNDTAGALLAWRGFARHRRLSVLGEDLPTAPLASLAPDGQAFVQQRRFATEPFGTDLDSRAGYAARVRWERSDLGVQLSWIDNGGDRRLYGDQYAWDTRWLQMGVRYEGIERLTLIGELQHGQTDMGLAPDARVALRFDVAYLLAAWSWTAQWQSAVRIDWFRIDEQDFSIAENNAEHGRGLSLNLAWQAREQQRWMLEYSVLKSDRPGARDEGQRARRLEQSLLLEWRWYWR